MSGVDPVQARRFAVAKALEIGWGDISKVSNLKENLEGRLIRIESDVSQIKAKIAPKPDNGPEPFLKSRLCASSVRSVPLC